MKRQQKIKGRDDKQRGAKTEELQQVHHTADTESPSGTSDHGTGKTQLTTRHASETSACQHN